MVQGFAERKILLVSQVIQRCRSYHNAAVRQARRAAAHPPAVVSAVAYPGLHTWHRRRRYGLRRSAKLPSSTLQLAWLGS